MSYYLIHEGAHFLYAILTGTFRQISFFGIGVQIDIYQERMSDEIIGNQGNFILCNFGNDVYCSYLFGDFVWVLWWWRHEWNPTVASRRNSENSFPDNRAITYVYFLKKNFALI